MESTQAWLPLAVECLAGCEGSTQGDRRILQVLGCQWPGTTSRWLAGRDIGHWQQPADARISGSGSHNIANIQH